MVKLIPQLSESKVYHQISVREHSKFLKFQANPTRKLSIKKLKEWLTRNMKCLCLNAINDCLYDVIINLLVIT